MKTFQGILSGGKSILEPSLNFWSVKIFNLSLDLHFDLYQVYCILLLVSLGKILVKDVCRLSRVRTLSIYVIY